MPFSASPEPEGDWQSSSPCSGQCHWGTPCTREGWITSEDQAFIKDAEQMLEIIKDSLLGIKSMYSTLLSSSYFLFSLWYASAVSLYTFRHMFWLQEHHCTFPISCSGPGCLSFQPRLVLEGSGKFPEISSTAPQPGCVRHGGRGSNPIPKATRWGHNTCPLHTLLPCSPVRTQHTSHMFFSKGSSFLKRAKHWTQQKSRN